MKKILTYLVACFLSAAFLPSCEKGELLNSEADIIEVFLPDSLKVGPALITNTTVRIPKMAIRPEEKEKLDNQLKNVMPKFILTKGATILDADSARDFTQPQFYTVVSEDKNWNKKYEISFFNAVFKNTKLPFEHFDIDAKCKYHKFYETDSLGTKLFVWDSGNAGFAIPQCGVPAVDYPTASTPKGKVGAGVRLTTCSTGDLGSMLNMPIAAGNLFLGYFNVSIATKRPLEATEFGIQTTMEKPKSIGMWCKYKEGPEYKDAKGNVLNIQDRPEIYAVVYEPKTDEAGNHIKLNGTNVKTADNIVLIAVVSEEQAKEIRVDNIESDDYVYIEVPFEERKSFDPEKQKNGDYYVAAVFSSSVRGNLFEGAIGSTLYVDEVEFIINK